MCPPGGGILQSGAESCSRSEMFVRVVNAADGRAWRLGAINQGESRVPILFESCDLMVTVASGRMACDSLYEVSDGTADGCEDSILRSSWGDNAPGSRHRADGGTDHHGWHGQCAVPGNRKLDWVILTHANGVGGRCGGTLLHSDSQFISEPFLGR
jgi:hypothetical protein